MSDENKLSVSARYVIELCKKIISDVKDGECSEEEINNIILKTEPRHNGYINPKDYMNADKSCDYLGVHRPQFFSLLKKYKVKVNKINNQPIGYYIKDLERIKCGERT